MPEEAVEVQGSQRKDTVWVNGSDGACWARFSIRFGMDVHKSLKDQMDGESECLACTHEPATEETWRDFIALVAKHHGVTVPYDLIEFPLTNAMPAVRTPYETSAAHLA